MMMSFLTAFDKYDVYWLLIGAATLYLCIHLMNRTYFPSIDTVHTLVELANTKGGIILILWFTTMIFFWCGIKIIFWSAGLNPSDPSERLVLSGFNWVTGAAFGGAFGAMIKTMTGETLPANTAQSSTTVTSGPPAPPAPPIPPAPTVVATTVQGPASVKG